MPGLDKILGVRLVKHEAFAGNHVNIMLLTQPYQSISNGSSGDLELCSDFRLTVDNIKFQIIVQNHVLDVAISS